MPDTIPADSVGLVTPQKLHIDTPVTFESGRSLPSYDLVYETYGELNADQSNAIVIFHSLTGSQHVAVTRCRLSTSVSVCIHGMPQKSVSRMFVITW